MKSKPKNGRGPVTKRAARLPKGPAVEVVRESDPEIAAAADGIAQEIIAMANVATIARRKVAAALQAVNVLGGAMLAFHHATEANDQELCETLTAVADAMDAIQRAGLPSTLPSRDALVSRLCDAYAAAATDTPTGRAYAAALQGAVRRALYDDTSDDDAARGRMRQARRRAKQTKRIPPPPLSREIREVIDWNREGTPFPRPEELLRPR